MIKNIYNGIRRESMEHLLVLGIFPAFAVTTSLKNAVVMGVATIFVMFFSGLFISLFRKFISSAIKLHAFFIVIATFTTVAGLLLQAYFPEQSKSLGIYIPLIVVNGLVLNRADIFVLNNKIIYSLSETLVIGLIFTLALMLLGSFREILGNGSILDYKIISDNARTILFIILPPGAFITAGFLIAFIRKLEKTK
jgi:Na+-translocating ferredoxin:NAD+ oxidoreductase subunit E